MRYNRARQSLRRHASSVVAASVAGAWRFRLATNRGGADHIGTARLRLGNRAPSDPETVDAVTLTRPDMELLMVSSICRIPSPGVACCAKFGCRCSASERGCSCGRSAESPCRDGDAFRSA